MSTTDVTFPNPRTTRKARPRRLLRCAFESSQRLARARILSWPRGSSSAHAMRRPPAPCSLADRFPAALRNGNQRFDAAVRGVLQVRARRVIGVGEKLLGTTLDVVEHGRDRA